MNYKRKTAQLNTATGMVRRFAGILLAIALIFVASTVYDMLAFTKAGSMDGFPGFEALLKENPDTVAWIRLDGTHIDHPVVQGKDNFTYVNKGFDGKYYQGGAIFLDIGNKKDFSDEYIIIHGHHMDRGAMFSDVASYTEKDFFEDNKTGDLITPDALYQLYVVGVKMADAYEGELYYVAPDVKRPLHLMDDCLYKRDVEFKDDDKLVLLSTCAGDMTTSRVVVFCRARKMS